MGIMFSTGPYIFGEDYNYQKPLFQEFFEELKTYKPDHIDSANKSLYWKIENAKDIYNDFGGILKKYHDKNSAQLRDRKAQKLRDELKRLEGSDD